MRKPFSPKKAESEESPDPNAGLSAVERAEIYEQQQAAQQASGSNVTKSLLTVAVAVGAAVAALLIVPTMLPKSGPPVSSLSKKSLKSLASSQGRSANFHVDTTFALISSSGRDLNSSVAADGSFNGSDLTIKADSSETTELQGAELRVADNGIYFKDDKGTWYGLSDAVPSEFGKVSFSDLPGPTSLLAKMMLNLQGYSFNGPNLDGVKTWQINVNLAESEGLLRLLSGTSANSDEKEDIAARQAVLNSVSLKLYIGQSDSLPRRLELTVKGPTEDFTVAGTNPISSALSSIDVSATIDFSDWGQAKPITAPKTSQDIFKLLQKLLNKATAPVLPPKPDS